MKKFTIAVFLPAAILLLSTGDIAAAHQSLSGKITGSWQGEGALMGAPARFDMQWFVSWLDSSGLEVEHIYAYAILAGLRVTDEHLQRFRETINH